ncbi:MAG: SMI1/KNR4 family protein [Clostridium sp.]|nr:SMI1/KNR4 family protein [Clostridium sp.]
MENFCELLKKSEDFVSVNGAEEAEITVAEEALSLRFAKDYREYLAAYGAASANGHEFTGVIKSARLNVVDVTKRERERNAHASNAFYVVEECLIDGIIIWQTATGEVFQSVGNGGLKKVYDSLADYFLSDF